MMWPGRPMIAGLTRLLLYLGLVVHVSGCVAGETEKDYFRSRTARPNETIFSPLDLPAPNRIRSGSGAPGPDYWQQQVDYTIEATLDAENDTVTAHERIVYTNNSPDALDYLWVHLEQNIFRNDSLGSMTRPNASIAMNDSTTQGMIIESLTSNGSPLEYAVYDTLALVQLDEPVAPEGGRFAFEIAWRFDIPRDTFRRFGREEVEQGVIYEIAQWFPAVAVYDDYYGWNTLPYMGTGEFYTNFGNYDIKLTVPRTHLVAATGVLQNPDDVFTADQLERISAAKQSDETVMIRSKEEVEDPASRPRGVGPLTWHFKAENVRTVAWASSDAFIYDGCNVDGIFVQSMYPVEATPNWEQSTQMLKSSIEGYNEMWHRYPYPEATNVNGPEGGMEYPMIIFCGSRRSERGLYGVTTHEIGHNWFPMMVNTDERRHAWMDEGFNTFINYYSIGDWFEGEYGGRGDAASFAEEMTEPHRVPMETHADKLPRHYLGRTQYAKPAVGLVLLREQILGPERFDFAFRTYIRRWAFKSPRPADFFRTMEDASGMDLAWFWRGWFLETAYLDQALGQEVKQEFDEDRKVWVIELPILNEAELVMPVVFKVTYEDQSEEVRKLPVEIWYPSDRFETMWVSDQKAVRVELDPEQVMPDVDRTNNVWSSNGSKK